MGENRYVLRETVARRDGRDLWFRCMTALGPCTTADLSEARVFDSEEAARKCPAMWHALTYFEPEALNGGGSLA